MAVTAEIFRLITQADLSGSKEFLQALDQTKAATERNLRLNKKSIDTARQMARASANTADGLKRQADLWGLVARNVDITSKEYREATRELGRLERKQQQLQRGGFGSNFRQQAAALPGGNVLAAGSIGGAAGAAAGLAVAGGVVAAGAAGASSFINAVELETQRRRLELVSRATGDYSQALAASEAAARKFNISQADAAAQLAQVSVRLRPMGFNLQEVTTIQEGFNTAARLSGSTAQEASAAFLQLSQSLGAGALRGEEFNSVAEQAPLVLVAISEVMDQPVGALKDLAAEGRITADIVVEALNKIKEENEGALAESFDSPQARLEAFGVAWENISSRFGSTFLPPIIEGINQITEAMKSLDEYFGSSTDVGAYMQWLMQGGGFSEQSFRDFTQPSSSGQPTGSRGGLDVLQQQAAARREAQAAEVRRLAALDNINAKNEKERKAAQRAAEKLAREAEREVRKAEKERERLAREAQLDQNALIRSDRRIEDLKNEAKIAALTLEITKATTEEAVEFGKARIEAMRRQMVFIRDLRALIDDPRLTEAQRDKESKFLDDQYFADLDVIDAEYEKKKEEIEAKRAEQLQERIGAIRETGDAIEQENEALRIRNRLFLEGFSDDQIERQLRMLEIQQRAVEQLKEANTEEEKALIMAEEKRRIMLLNEQFKLEDVRQTPAGLNQGRINELREFIRDAPLDVLNATTIISTGMADMVASLGRSVDESKSLWEDLADTVELQVKRILAAYLELAIRGLIQSIIGPALGGAVSQGVGGLFNSDISSGMSGDRFTPPAGVFNKPVPTFDYNGEKLVNVKVIDGVMAESRNYTDFGGQRSLSVRRARQ